MALMLLAGLFCGIEGYAQESGIDDFLEMSIEDLMNIEVVTSTKSSSTVEKAPSIVTVITADDIQKQGLRSLNDVLMRVPGFYTSPGKPMHKISNRSFSQDHNSNILLLIDGHSQNSINIFGMYYQHVFPMLNKVKRIEIIRGPGSTLWGSDAASGIINIITKDGSDINTGGRFGNFEFGYNHEFENNIKAANILYGKTFNEQTDLFLSYTNMRSNAPWHRVFDVFTNGDPREPGATDTNFDWHPSHELFFKFRISDFKFSGRYLDLNSISPQRTGSNKVIVSDANWDHSWLEVEYNKKLSERYSLVSKLFL